MKKYPQPRFHETGHPDTILTLVLVTANRYELFHKILLPNSFLVRNNSNFNFAMKYSLNYKGRNYQQI